MPDNANPFLGSLYIVIDNGSGLIKAGFAGDNACHIQKLPTIVTCARTPEGAKAFCISDQTGMEKRGHLVLKYPIDRGIVTNWDHMEKIWKETFVNFLRVPPEAHPVLLTEAPLTPKAKRGRMIQTMFETFGVPKLYVGNSAVLSLYASGRTTGCLVACGHGVTNCVPVYEGYVLSHAVVRMDLAGKDLTDYMIHILKERELDTRRYTSERCLVNDMKESLCFVSLDFDRDMNTAAESSALEKPFELPNGEILNIGNERFRCPEILFRPALGGIEMDGIAQNTVRAVVRCDSDIQHDLFGNIVLAGGSTLFPGIVERMTNEINTALAPSSSSFQISVAAPQDRKDSAWLGGSIVAALPAFQKMWVSKKDYETSGLSGIVMHPLI